MPDRPIETGDVLFWEVNDRWQTNPKFHVGEVVRTTKTLAIVNYRDYGRELEARFKKDSWRSVSNNFFDAELFNPKGPHGKRLRDQSARNWWAGFIRKSHDVDTLIYLQEAMKQRD